MRRGAPAPLLAAGLAAVVLLLGAACDDSPGSAPPARRAAPPETCAGVRPSLGCEAIEVDGRVYRYAIRAAKGGAGSRDAALVDLGGPGRSLFGSDDLLRFAAGWPGDQALVFVEEPWVTRPSTGGCDAARSGFYRSLRRSGENGEPATALVTACGLARSGSWGWDAADYARVVQAIARHERLVLTGLVATSYGALRSAPLWSLPSLRWLVLDSPAPPKETGTSYLRARARGVASALRRSCAPCPDRAREASAELRRDPVALDTRTPAVEPVDLEAALVAAAYLPAGQRRALFRLLGGPVRRAAPLIGRLSDATLLRYGSYEMSPAVLAYLDEVCRRYGPWPAASERPNLLARLHAPCRSLWRPAGDADLPTGPADVCIAHGGLDDVVPRDTVARWRTVFPRARAVALRDAVHGAPELAAECYRVAVTR